MGDELARECAGHHRPMGGEQTYNKDSKLLKQVRARMVPTYKL